MFIDFKRLFHDVVYMENNCHVETRFCMHERKHAFIYKQ